MSGRRGTNWMRHWTFGSQLFISYVFIIVTGMVVVFVGFRSLAPGFFDQAMAYMMGDHTTFMMRAMDQAMSDAITVAFREAIGSSMVLATAAAGIVAVIASLILSQRVATPLQRLAIASRRIADGHYAERVEVSGSVELSALANSFNQMAASLEETERRRLALVADVAHELRTPLATVEGYVEGLLDGIVTPTPETFALLHQETGRLRRLVDDLQELSRAEARQLTLNPRPVSAGLLVESAVALLKPQFDEKGLTLVVDVPPDLPMVRADADRTAQVLTNLLSNAWRYTPPGGSVSLSARRQGDMVELTVQDTGIGISANDLPHVFERFYRSDHSRSRAGGGSGIGLTIAKHLVEAQGGSIWAQSAGPGRGSTFTFTLPVNH